MRNRDITSGTGRGNEPSFCFHHRENDLRWKRFGSGKKETVHYLSEPLKKKGIGRETRGKGPIEPIGKKIRSLSPPYSKLILPNYKGEKAISSNGRDGPQFCHKIQK